MKFLRSNSVQSTLRVIVFMTAVAVCINLGFLPVLIALALLLGQDLTWLGVYLGGLATLSGAAILGKVIQKNYETKVGITQSEDSTI